MSSILGLLQLAMFLMGVLVLAFMILLALPQCRLRDCCLQCAGWGLAIICAIYCISPVDLFPVAFLPIDDFAAFLVGLGGAMQAWQAGDRQKFAA